MDRSSVRRIVEMLKEALLSTLLLTGIIGGIGAQREVVVGGYHRFPLGATVKVLGVCSYSQESVSCWDLDSRVDEFLTKQVKDLIVRSQELRLRVGRKNRIIVTETTGSVSNLTFQRSPAYVLTASSAESPSLCLAYADYSNSDSTGSLQFTITDSDVKHRVFLPTRMRAQEALNMNVATYEGFRKLIGSNASMRSSGRTDWRLATVDDGGVQLGGSGTVRFGGQIIGRSFGGMFGPVPVGTSWLHVISWAIDQNDQYQSVLLDRNKNPIIGLDPNGRPVDPKVLQQWQTSAPDPRLTPKYKDAYQTALRITPSVVTISTNIDPKYVGYVSLTPVATHRAVIENLPLDPRSRGMALAHAHQGRPLASPADTRNP